MPQSAAPQPALPEPADPGPEDEVVVEGVSRPFALSARALRAGARAFGEGRTRFAPRAALLFEVRGRGRTAGLALRFTDGARAVPVALDAAGRFAAPALPPGDWRLVANRPRGALALYPRVATPGVPEPARRLGDLRLQCRVMWAMERSQASLAATPAIALLGLAGPCTSGRVGVYAALDVPADRAELVERGQTLPVALWRSRGSYRLPVHARGFSDEAELRFHPAG